MYDRGVEDLFRRWVLKMFHLINIGDLADRWNGQLLHSAGGDVVFQATN